MPTPTPTPTPTPLPECAAESPKTASFAPPDTRLDAYRLGFTWDNRPRFRVRNTQAALLDEQTDCQAAAAIQAQLRVTDLAGVGPACPRCSNSVTGPTAVRVEADAAAARDAGRPLPAERADSGGRRMANGRLRRVHGSGPGMGGRGADVEPYRTHSCVPIIVLAGASLVATRVVRHRLDVYEEEPTPLRDILIVGPDSMGAPIVRLGFFAWRRADVEDGGDTGVSNAYLSLAGLVAGPLVARFHSPRASVDTVDDMQPQNQFSVVLRHVWATVSGARTLAVGRRLHHSAFEDDDGREYQLQLVRRLDPD